MEKLHIKETDFWISQSEIKNICPNASIFRFIASIGKKLDGAKVLEIGFGYGADILEMAKRGAQVYGIDINSKFVEAIKPKICVNKNNFIACDIVADDMPFPDKFFDLVFCHGFLCYFSYDEIEHLFKKIRSKLRKNGIFIFDFVQADLQRRAGINNIELYNFQKFNKLKYTFADRLVGMKNLVKFLSIKKIEDIIHRVNFSVIGSKLLIESYDSQEINFRYHKYFACSK